MGEGKHTPGPWTVEVLPHNGYPYGITAVNGDNRKAGAVGARLLRWGAFMLPSSVEAAANAQLMATAPILLEALKGLTSAAGEVADFLGEEDWTRVQAVLDGYLVAARTAIAQAKASDHG